MKLTILTVSYGHRTFLLENARLAATLNAGFFSDVEWHVAENAPAGHPDRVVDGEPGFILHRGRGEPGKGISHHHASALNHLLHTLPLRGPVMIIDPDLYLLQHQWVDTLVGHMFTSRLDFFGVPWHPKHDENYRYFPAVHCFVFDADRVPPTELDFTPIVEHLALRKSLRGRLLNRVPLFGYRLLRRSWDTGSRVARRFADPRRWNYEVVTPVCPPPLTGGRPGGQWIERLLPDWMCLDPKREAYSTPVTFYERGWIAEPLPPDWECFVWNDAPFAIHVRRSFASHRRNDASETERLPHTIASILSGTTCQGH